ncbi:MAG: alpha-amylase family glycosyl hydrolase, partial [Pseudomonadota bacterium]
GFRLDALNFSMHDRSLKDNPPSGVSSEDATRPFDMQVHQNNMSQPESVGFIEKFRAMLEDFPGKFTVAEVGGPQPIGEMKAFTEGEERLNSAYNFDFLYAPELTPERIKTSAGLWDQSEGEGWPSWAFSNHDAPRCVTRWAAPEYRDEMARLCMMLLLSLRGNPIIYQGEELALPQAHVPFEHLKDPEAIINWPKTLGRDGARTPFPWMADAINAGFGAGQPWLPVDPDHTKLALDRQQGHDSMVAFTRRALSLRKRLSALIAGDMRFLPGMPEHGLAIARHVEDQTVLALFNLTGQSLALPPMLDLGGEVVLSSKAGGDGLQNHGELPAYCGVWLAQGSDAAF